MDVTSPLAFESTSLSEMLLLCTVRIEVTIPDETAPESDVVVSATGFLFQFEPQDRVPVLAVVTNKHVLEGARWVAFFFHTAANVRENVGKLTGVAQQVKLPDPLQGWLQHPNSDVDLCAHPCQELLARTEVEFGVRLVQRPLARELIWSDHDMATKLSAAEEVLMVGYPNGLWDRAHNLPLFRRGITATPASVDFNGCPEGLLDIVVSALDLRLVGCARRHPG